MLTVVRSKVILLVQHFSCWAISFPVLIAFFVTFILPSLRFPSIARWLEPAEHHTSFWGQAPFLFYFYLLLSSASFIRFFLGSSAQAAQQAAVCFTTQINENFLCSCWVTCTHRLVHYFISWLVNLYWLEEPWARVGKVKCRCRCR